MARLGAFCFPGTGHLNPLTALARRLQQRGHTVIIFGIADVEARVKAAGIEFCLIGQRDYPPGTLQKLDRQLGEMTGLQVIRFTMERISNTARMVLRDGLEAVRNANLDAMLVDEADMANNIAEYLGLPFVSLALIPPIVQDNRYPPFYFGWSGSQRWWSRLRNEIAIRVLIRVAAPIFAAVNERRAAWGLKVAGVLATDYQIWRRSRSCRGRLSLKSIRRLRTSITRGRLWMQRCGPRWTLPGTGSTAGHWCTLRWVHYRIDRWESSAKSLRRARA